MSPLFFPCSNCGASADYPADLCADCKRRALAWLQAEDMPVPLADFVNVRGEKNAVHHIEPLTSLRHRKTGKVYMRYVPVICIERK